MSAMTTTRSRILPALIVLAIGAGSAAHAAPAGAAEAEPPKPTVVLVHGAWADSSSWSSVVRRLQRHGYEVDVPANPLRGLTSDVAYLAS